jgi:sugar lactone lactonase YvrE
MLPGRGNDAQAKIYAINADLSVRVLVDGLNTTNGLAFSPDGGTFYYSDSFADVRKIWSAPYDGATGAMGLARLFVDFADLPGKPDGAAIDREGGYWSAAMGSPFIHRFTPDGRLDLSLELPLDTPTRPAFGGDRMSTLYLTTGGLKNGETDDRVKGGLLAIPTQFMGVDARKARFRRSNGNDVSNVWR